MPDEENRVKRRPLKNLPPDRFQPKLWLIYLFIAGLLFLLWRYNPGRISSPAPLKIQEVVDYAAAGKIAEGVIRPDPAGGRVVARAGAAGGGHAGGRGGAARPARAGAPPGGAE